MTVHLDVWLRGDDFATTTSIDGISRDPQDWVDGDVRQVLEGMLLAMHRLKHRRNERPAITLRGLSWIVNPYADGGVVIAIEIATGAVVAGPFEIEQSALESMIQRVLVRAGGRSRDVH